MLPKRSGSRAVTDQRGAICGAATLVVKVGSSSDSSWWRD
ncbi:glutamate 5-kinase [Cutibacterium acnes JCM 18909]|nr:glutamate 5-kinase [Cutibacterium acnes JCM 18909]